MIDHNLNPHAEARVAMAVWGSRYSKQTGGCMDFYAGLTAAEKATCAQIVDGILNAERADGTRTPAPSHNVVGGEPAGEVHLKLVDDHMPEDVSELIDYLREMACVEPDYGNRRLPTDTDDAAFDMAADKLEQFTSAFAEIERLRLATSEGTVAKRADRMWEIACEMQGRPVPGAAALSAVEGSEG